MRLPFLEEHNRALAEAAAAAVAAKAASKSTGRGGKRAEWLAKKQAQRANAAPAAASDPPADPAGAAPADPGQAAAPVDPVQAAAPADAVPAHVPAANPADAPAEPVALEEAAPADEELPDAGADAVANAANVVPQVMAVADEGEAHAGLEGADEEPPDELEEFEEEEDEGEPTGDALPHAEAALRMSGIEPAHPTIPNATGNAAASAEGAPGANAPTDVPSETADEYAKFRSQLLRVALLLVQLRLGRPPKRLRHICGRYGRRRGSGATVATVVALLDAYHMVRPHAQEEPWPSIATFILAATAAALVGVRWTLSAKSRLFQSGFNAEGNAAAAALQSADAAPPLAGVDTWRRLSHVTSGDKSFMTFWHEDWSPRKSSEAQESPSGALSNKSMRFTTSGGAEFELALLRRECDSLRKALDDSTRREQGLAAQLRAHRVLQEQAADGRVTPLAILDAAPQARGEEVHIALHPDSSFLGPLLQLIGDAACVEILLTAFTYDDPELTSAATAAKLRGANVRLLIDLQKAHACKESGKILQQLLQVEVRTTCGKSLSEVYGGGEDGVTLFV
ncbi:unnamed protein product, partial [Symbiodinium necroappetens]